MATKKTTFNASDLSVAEHMLQNLQNKLRGLDEVEKLIRLVSNRSQVISERRRTLAALDKEIAEREAATFEGAETAGKREAKKVIAKARKQAEDILAAATARRDAINKEVEAREAALAALNGRIEKARDTVRAVLTAA